MSTGCHTKVPGYTACTFYLSGGRYDRVRLRSVSAVRGAHNLKKPVEPRRIAGVRVPARKGSRLLVILSRIVTPAWPGHFDLVQEVVLLFVSARRRGLEHGIASPVLPVLPPENLAGMRPSPVSPRGIPWDHDPFLKHIRAPDRQIGGL